MVSRGPNPESDRIHHSNIYDETIYETAGLPSSYGSGSRESNLKSDFLLSMLLSITLIGSE